jgi:hypothetical protein
MKPLLMVSDAILDCTRRNDVVLEPFLGSGTTLLAAERTGRRCFGIELDPLYVDVAIERWQRMTGRKAQNSFGETFDFGLMTKPPPDDENVGYGRPPRATRWKKGQSGRRPTRLKPVESVVDLVDRLLLKEVTLAINGEAKTVTVLEAIISQLQLKEMGGSARASKILLKYRIFAGQHAERQFRLIFKDNGNT